MAMANVAMANAGPRMLPINTHFIANGANEVLQLWLVETADVDVVKTWFMRNRGVERYQVRAWYLNINTGVWNEAPRETIMSEMDCGDGNVRLEIGDSDRAIQIQMRP